jgi:zinc ribbon protein
MDLGSIFLGLALTLVVTFLVLWPLLERPGTGEPDAPPADPLLLTREQVLTQLRDLDFDHATGKLNEDDYATQRAQLMAQGVAVLKELDSQAAVPAGPEADEIRPLDEIERAISERRASRPAAPTSAVLRCPNCGAAVSAADRFCPRCGQALRAPAGAASKG